MSTQTTRDKRATHSVPTIHLVDDDEELLNALKFALELEGFDIVIHRDPRDLLAQGPALSGECLVVDQLMAPLSGLDLLAGLRQRGVAMPAILITTNPGAILRQRAARAGVPIVEKPLLGNRLSEAIRQAIG